MLFDIISFQTLLKILGDIFLNVWC